MGGIIKEQECRFEKYGMRNVQRIHLYKYAEL